MSPATASGTRSSSTWRTASARSCAGLRLCGKGGAGLVPWGAIRVAFDRADGAEREIFFRLGAGSSAGATGQLVQGFRGAAAARVALGGAARPWRHPLTALQ